MTEDEAVAEFCRAVGELILWTSIIDERLTNAICLMMIKDASPMARSLVAEIEFRRKVELLKTRARAITEADDWRKAICGWAELAEKVNRHRNTVAHHQIRFHDGGFLLGSQQATRILKDLNREPVDLKQILGWIELAKDCVENSNVVIANLEKFAAMWRGQQASAHSN